MTNNNSEKERLEELMRSASENIDEADEKNGESKGFPTKLILIIVGGVAGLALLLFAAFMMMPNQEFENKTETPKWVDNKTGEEEHIEKSEWDFEYPVNVPEWSKQQFTLSAVFDDELYETLIESAEDIDDINTATAWMPSAIEGDWEGAPPVFTSDPSEEYLKDGSLNPHYSYTIREDYLLAYSVYMQRLLNPTFGRWIFAQHYTPSQPLKNNTDLNVFEDMFSDEWWEENIVEGEDYSKLPILVDWEGDDFGGLEFAERQPGRYGTFFGVIDEKEDEGLFTFVEDVGVDENNSPVIKITTPVKYGAFGVDDELIEIDGTLSLTLSSNNQLHEEFRVIVSDAELLLE